jgi:hypothetical protein
MGQDRSIQVAMYHSFFTEGYGFDFVCPCYGGSALDRVLCEPLFHQIMHIMSPTIIHVRYITMRSKKDLWKCF